MKRILMTGGGAPGGPGVLKCLKLLGNGYEIYVADANENSSGRFLSNNFCVIPVASDDNFIDSLLKICKEKRIDIIFPLVTKELLLLSKAIDQFEVIGTRIIVSDYESLVIANNKSRLYTHLKGLGIKLPNFKVINNYNDFKIVSNEFVEIYGGYCIKPSVSNGSRGVRIVSKNLNSGDLLFNHKPNSIYVEHLHLNSILKDYSFPELLISEILPGREFTIDTILDNNGKPIVILPRERLKTNGGISVAGKFINDQKIISYCLEILNSLNLRGPIGLQVKEDKFGNFLLLEINPRIQGTSVAALGAGINLPKISVQLIENNKVDIPTVEWGVNFIRYYNEVFFRS